MPELKHVHSTLAKSASMRVSNAYFFGIRFCKIKHFSLNVEGLLMHVRALVEFVYASLNSDILIESCIS